MIFDKLAGIVERHWPSVEKEMRKARLFKFEGKPHEVLPKEHPQEEVDRMMESFFLPYDNIFIEDGGSGVYIGDEEEQQKGLTGERFFMACMPIDGSEAEYCNSDYLIGTGLEGQGLALGVDTQRLVALSPARERLSLTSGKRGCPVGSASWSQGSSGY